MKKILTLSLLCLICHITFGQKKDINLNEIWNEYKFYPKYLDEFKSTFDGEHYTTLNNA